MYGPHQAKVIMACIMYLYLLVYLTSLPLKSTYKCTCKLKWAIVITVKLDCLQPPSLLCIIHKI